MAEDKVIKSGQLTLPRLAFLALCGIILFLVVATGQLAIGYLLVSGALCLLLLLVAFDYHVAYDVTAEKTAQSSDQPGAAVGATEPATPATTPREARPRRRTSRSARRRR